MCAHIGQNRHIYYRVYSAYIFDSYTPSPFSAGWRWGLLSRKIFSNFIFSFLLFDFYSYFIFFIFSDFRLVYPILGFQLNSFTEYLRFNLFIFARYYLDYDSWLRFWISTRFSSHQFRLVSALSIIHFNSSTLYLFDSSAYYKQTSMFIWVCFMLVLAILRLSDVFSFVLGVVYRLWIK